MLTVFHCFLSLLLWLCVIHTHKHTGVPSLLSWLTSSLTLMQCLRQESGAACTQVSRGGALPSGLCQARSALHLCQRNSAATAAACILGLLLTLACDWLWAPFFVCLSGFLLALGLDPNLNPYHQTLTTYTKLDHESPASSVVAARPATPYEVGASGAVSVGGVLPLKPPPRTLLGVPKSQPSEPHVLYYTAGSFWLVG